MIVRRYHVVYQGAKEFYVSTGWHTKTEWFEGPYSYDEGLDRVKKLNSLNNTGKTFMLAREDINMSAEG